MTVFSRGVRPIASLGVAVIGSGLIAGSGCAAREQRPVTLFPAAVEQHDERPILIQPYEDVKPGDAIVRIVSDVTCTGTIVAEDLVLTAHHCVAARDRRGHVLDYDKDPADLTVELGDDALPWAEVGVKAIVSPDCGYISGAGDIAILVLQRKMIGMATYTPRLDTPPKASEILKPVGFGHCVSSPVVAGALQRVERASDRKGIAQVAPGYFVANASICPGDSGGPVLVERAGIAPEVVGIISASAMDGDDHTTGPSVFTRIDPWRRLFSAAREIADGATASELPPFRTCD